MKFLFVLQYPGYLRYFDSVVEALLTRSHQVSVAFDQPHKQAEGLAAFKASGRAVEVLGRTPVRADVWEPVARGVRGTVDYIRYLHPRFADSPYLRNRMRKVLPPLTRFLGRWEKSTEGKTRRLLALLDACERAIPSNKNLDSFLQQVSPDVLIVSPLVTDQCPQVDMIKSARRVGIPSVLGVASWDHLTTKGLMRIQPDLVTLWNHHQRREAIEFHAASGDRIAITGAQCFDRWFDRKPRLSRERFCRRVGLPVDEAFIVFVGSTASISAPDTEVRFVKRWIEAIRLGPGTLSTLGILIRPHPYNSNHWQNVDLTGYRSVVVFPNQGANPVDDDDRADYYDTLHHSMAVVGINTSAMIEAGIQDRPVFTIIDSSFDRTQTGTLHFQYLLPENGGHLQRATSLDEHVSQLVSIIDTGGLHSSRRFIEAFVRPYGFDVPATPRFVTALEGLDHVAPIPPDAVSGLLVPLQAFLWAIGLAASRKRLKKRLIRFMINRWGRLKKEWRLPRLSRTIERPQLTKAALDAVSASGDAPKTQSEQSQNPR